MPVGGDDDGRQRRLDPLGAARAEMFPGRAEDVVLLVGVGRDEEVDEAPHQALLLRKLLRVVPLTGLGTVLLRKGRFRKIEYQIQIVIVPNNILQTIQ